MQLFFQPDITQGVNQLDTEESRHAIKVLRLKIGDQINIIDGKGTFYKAVISNDNFRKCEFKITSQEQTPPTNGYKHIAIAPTKNIDRTEWFVEKAVEIGIDRISFVLCKNSERKVLKTDRLMKKAISAMKQSIKATLPVIDEIEPFQKFVTKPHDGAKFIAFVDFENPTALKDLVTGTDLVLVGPEGDFNSEEVDFALKNGFQKVSLGQSRLRTETAGIATAHILNLFA
ncbi:16S rRNA (uracil(1498)-N(3))-methyltransferase [Roseivirga misakiensis]|uniref:Ribosomal RNA small subunit methyltransferase E n=1 Tax=Roseivirga misakiensis TaxID=1563681 RepID=A0A1E5SZ86_9BACT|nr:16S rRNA (uracil(1498)-N(3))-methyltransferase [Roseivirga misakiensis]OEK04448.1 16S rRNA (uracil(1498)-N(3))-methyltransferase [Roseivirga misakiensis]